MSWTVILVASLGCYLLKWSGAVVPARWLDGPAIRRAAALLPIALLVGLIITQTFDGGRRLTLDARIPGILVALLAVRLRAPFLAVVVSAAVTTALVRAIG